MTVIRRWGRANTDETWLLILMIPSKITLFTSWYKFTNYIALKHADIKNTPSIYDFFSYITFTKSSCHNHTFFYNNDDKFKPAIYSYVCSVCHAWTHLWYKETKKSLALEIKTSLCA
jgi:hypothetical protein